MKLLWKRALPLLLCLVTLLTLFPVTRVQAAEEYAMETSQEYIDMLKGWEGFRSTPYWDVSHYSIGYGTTCPDDKVDYYTKNPMSKAQAEKELKKYLDRFEESVNGFAKKHSLKLKQNQFDALVSFTYNCGDAWTTSLDGYFNTAVRYGDTGRLFLYGIGLYSSAGGDYILMKRRMREANMYINGEYTSDYPDNYRWVFLNGGGAMPRYPIYCFDAKKPEEIKIRFSDIPTGKTEDGTPFVYEFAGWYTEDGKKVEKADTSLERGQILYARWKDPEGNVATLPTGTPVEEQKLTIVKDKANIRSGPGTYYDKTGTLEKGATLTLKETYVVGSTTWGNTNKGWLSLGNTDYEAPEETFPKTGKVNTNEVNYRTGPSTDYKKVGEKDKGDKVTIVEVNEKNTWGKMSDGNWIYLKYVTYDENVITKLELLKKPDKLVYDSTKRILELEGSVVRITYADGTQLARTLGIGDVEDDRTDKCTSATVTATIGGKKVSFGIEFRAPEALKITTQPKNVSVAENKTAKVSVAVKGDGLKYKWYYKDKTASKFKVDKEQTGKTYSVKLTAARNGRQVYCVITDKYGYEAKTKTVTISIPSVKITKQPSAATVLSGKTAKVAVTAEGVGLKYQWYYKDASSSKYKKSSAKTNTYTTTMNAKRAGRSVYCVITDKYGNSVKSKVVVLNMAEVRITKQPKSVAVKANDTAKVSVTATGNGLSYKWYYKDESASKFKVDKNQTENTYSAKITVKNSGREVYCQVSDKYGNKRKTDTVTLSVKPTITKQPKGVTVLKGKSVKVTVDAEGEGLKYQWYYKDASASKFKKSSAKKDTYTTTMSNARSGRQVYCVITDKFGNSVKTKTVTLTMANVKITGQPVNVAVKANGTAKVSVTATGTGLSYKWYYKDESASKFKVDKSQTESTYSAKITVKNSGREVYCVVTDKYGNSLKTKTVTLCVKATVTKQPANVTAASGKKVSVTVSAAGEGLKYQWYYKDATATKFTKSSTRTATYSTTMNAKRAGRQVYCVITDKFDNSVKTKTATLKMK